MRTGSAGRQPRPCETPTSTRAKLGYRVIGLTVKFREKAGSSIKSGFHFFRNYHFPSSLTLPPRNDLLAIFSGLDSLVDATSYIATTIIVPSKDLYRFQKMERCMCSRCSNAGLTLNAKGNQWVKRSKNQVIFNENFNFLLLIAEFEQFEAVFRLCS